MANEKPPTGLIPARFWRERVLQERITEILAAMQRYSEARKVIPQEWIDELAERNNEAQTLPQQSDPA